MYRILQAFTVACLAYGLWLHDGVLIAGAAMLSVMWWLISDEVLEPTR